MLKRPNHSKLVPTSGPQPFRIALLRVAFASLKEATDLVALVNGVSEVMGATDRSVLSSLDAIAVIVKIS